LNLTGRTTYNENCEESIMIFFYIMHFCILLCGILLDMESRLTEQIFLRSTGCLKKLKYLCLNKFYSFLGAFTKLRKMTVASSYMSALSSVGVEQRIFTNLGIWVFFEDVSRKWKFH